MTVNRKPTGTAVSIPVGLSAGAFTSITVTLLGALLTAKLIDYGMIDWEKTGYAVLIILLLSSWIGSVVSAGKIKRQRLIICLASGVIYFLILLLISALFFGGQYSGIWETAILIFCGAVLGVFSGYREKSRRKARKRVISNR